MALLLCPNCSVAMTESRRFGLTVESCPKCGGAWCEAASFAALLEARTRTGSRHADGGEIAGHGGTSVRERGDRDSGARAPSTGYVLAGLLALALLAGAAGYFVVRPFLPHAADALQSKEVAASAQKLGGSARSLVQPYAAEAGKAAKQRIDTAIRDALGLPAASNQGAEQKSADAITPSEQSQKD